MSKDSQTFGEQAARFSLYAPLAVLLIGVFTYGNRETPGVAVAVGSINLLLLFAGFTLGIAALISMKRFGRERILGRAIGGLVLNGGALCALLIILVPILLAANVKQQIVGHWKLTSNATNAIELTLKADGKFHLHGAAPGTIVPQTDVDGKWVFTRDRMVGVETESVNGKDPGPDRKIGLGRIRSVNDTQLILSTDTGEEVYLRIP